AVTDPAVRCVLVSTRPGHDTVASAPPSRPRRSERHGRLSGDSRSRRGARSPPGQAVEWARPSNRQRQRPLADRTGARGRSGRGGPAKWGTGPARAGSRLLALDPVPRRLEGGDQVANRLEPDGEPDVVGRGARGGLRFLGEL